MFSGHAVVLWICFLTYNEYCTSKWLIRGLLISTICGTLAIVGTLFHYTLDVSVAIFVSYSSWTIYHRYAKNESLQDHSGIAGKVMQWIEQADDIHETKFYY